MLFFRERTLLFCVCCRISRGTNPALAQLSFQASWLLIGFGDRYTL